MVIRIVRCYNTAERVWTLDPERQIRASPSSDGCVWSCLSCGIDSNDDDCRYAPVLMICQARQQGHQDFIAWHHGFAVGATEILQGMFVWQGRGPRGAWACAWVLHLRLTHCTGGC